MADLGQYFPFWAKLTSEQQRLLEEAVHERSFHRGEILHNGSADCVGLLLVLKGQLRVYTVSDEGRELTLYRLLERDFCLFSASCVLNSIQFDVTVSAAEDTTVLHMPPELYKKLMGESLAVSEYTNRLMASRFSDVMWLIDQIMNKKLDSRLAALLLEERDLTGQESLAITHEQLANHLGTAREVVTRMMKYFQSEGLVALSRGTVKLVSPEKLEKLAEASRR